MYSLARLNQSYHSMSVLLTATSYPRTLALLQYGWRKNPKVRVWDYCLRILRTHHYRILPFVLRSGWLRLWLAGVSPSFHLDFLAIISVYLFFVGSPTYFSITRVSSLTPFCKPPTAFGTSWLHIKWMVTLYSTSELCLSERQWSACWKCTSLPISYKENKQEAFSKCLIFTCPELHYDTTFGIQIENYRE